jgi:hypothetical protein
MASRDSEGRSSARFANLALCLAFVGAAAMIYYHQGLLVPRALAGRAAHHLDGGYSFGNDFYQIWLTSRIRFQNNLTVYNPAPDSENPYSDAVTREIQIGLYGRPLDPQISSDPKDRRTFPYPAFTDLLFWPAAKFSFPVARNLLLCLLALLAVATVWLWMRALRWGFDWKWTAVTLLIFLSSYSVLEGLYAIQIGLLVAFLLAASLLALERGKLTLSGILMAFTTIKPQVTLLAVLYLLFWSSHNLRRRWHFCAGFFATTFLLIATSLLVWPHWIQSWLHLLTAYREYNPPPLLGVLLASLGPVARPLSFALTLALLIGAIVFAWRNRAASPGSLDFWLTLTLLLGLTVVGILPGQAVYDHVILLPGILLLALRWRQFTPSPILKALLVIGVAVLLWPLLASCALIAARPLLTPQVFYSKPIFSLPLCLALGFPFVVLAALALAMRGRKTAAAPAPVSSSS